MSRIKRIIAMALSLVFALSISGFDVMAAENEVYQEEYIEISLADDSVTSTASTGYYSKGLVVLNIATSGVSNQCTITSGSVPAGATITKVELTGRKSNGSGTVYWYVTHNASGLTASKLFGSPATFYNFNGLTANSSWTVWIQGSPWSTVKGGSIKVYYSY